MKTVLTVIFLSPFIFACKKEKKSPPPQYTCSCMIESGGIYKTNSYLLENTSAKEARKDCESRSGIKHYDFGGSGSLYEKWTCNLK